MWIQGTHSHCLCAVCYGHRYPVHCACARIAEEQVAGSIWTWNDDNGKGPRAIFKHLFQDVSSLSFWNNCFRDVTATDLALPFDKAAREPLNCSPGLGSNGHCGAAAHCHWHSTWSLMWVDPTRPDSKKEISKRHFGISTCTWIIINDQKCTRNDSEWFCQSFVFYWVISQSCTQVIQQFKIEWGQPFSNILEALELMAFDLDRCFLCEGFQMHRGICQEQKSMPFLAWSDTWLSWQQDAKVCQMLCNPCTLPSLLPHSPSNESVAKIQRTMGGGRRNRFHGSGTADGRQHTFGPAALQTKKLGIDIR